MSGLQQLMMSNFSAAGGGVGYVTNTLGSIVQDNIRSTQIFDLANSTFVYDPNQDVFVVFYYKGADASGSNKARAVRLNADNTLSIGSEYTWTPSLDGDDVDGTFDSNLNKIVAIYRDDGSDEQPRARIVTASRANLTLSFGAIVTLDASGNLANPSVNFAPNVNRVLALYEDDDGTDNLLFRNLSVNANNTITMNTAGTAQAGNQSYGDPSNLKFRQTYGNGVIFTSHSHNSGRARAYQVSSTSTSVGPEYAMNATSIGYRSPTVYVSSVNRFFVGTNNNHEVQVWSNSGTTLTKQGVFSVPNLGTESFILTYNPVSDILAAVTPTRIIEMTPTTTGATLTTEIEFPTAPPTVELPHFCRVDKNGKILLAYDRRGTVVVNDPNFNDNFIDFRLYVPTGVA